LANGNPETVAQKFRQLFNTEFYIAIHTNQTDEQKKFNEQNVEIAKKLGIPIIAEVDSHYILKEDADIHRKWKRISNDDEYYKTDDFYLHSENEVREKLSYLPTEVVEESIRNTKAIADICDFEPEFGGQHYPQIKIEDKLETIKGICRRGRYDKIVPTIPANELDKYRKQTIMELDMLDKANYPAYFLIVYHFIQNLIKQKIPYGIGRGSVGGSVVAWLMGITKINPLGFFL
jgi:DNA polymerase-3 subunit alpha